MEFKRPDPEIVRGFASFSTSTISDALDKFGIGGGCKGITPAIPKVKMVGTAYTVRYIPVGAIKGTVGDYIDDVLPGDVVVLDNNSRTDCTVWGDILTVTAKMKGISGTVIADGLQLKAKFTSLATDAVSASHAEELWQAIFTMEELGSISELTALLREEKR